MSVQHLGTHAVRLQNLEALSPVHCIVRLAQIDEHAIQWHLFVVCKLLRQLHLCCRCPRTSPGHEPVEAVMIIQDFQAIVHDYLHGLPNQAQQANSPVVATSLW